MVRVIAGKLKRKKLLVPGGDAVRPTLDRVKESVFSILGTSLRAHSFLDLFAGSGSMGIEALSRGAPFAVFVENDRNVAKVLESNIESCSLQDSCLLYKRDAVYVLGSLASKTPSGDFFVYVDPPYKNDFIYKAVLGSDSLKKLTKKGGIVLVEHPSGTELILEDTSLVNVRKEKYGKVSVSFFEVAASA